MLLHINGLEFWFLAVLPTLVVCGLVTLAWMLRKLMGVNTK